MTTLTSFQQAIVAHNQGHARVVAVAGAGKTTTLTHFIAQRLAEGISPRRLLVLMYNRNARLDFQRKLNKLLPQQPLPEIRTFHSLGLRIYQRLVQQEDLPAFSEKILTAGEVEVFVWRTLQQLADASIRQDILAQKKKWVEPALGFIDLVKSGLETPEQVFEAQDFPRSCKIFVPLFYKYEEWRRQNRRISYADMIYDPVQRLLKEPRLAQQFGGHMQWILVDEYQDINGIQQKLLEILHAGQGNLMVIGDPDQTIYEFRGSKPEFIVQQFNQRMGEVAQYQLPHTFRYGHQLSLIANHLISKNKERDPIYCLSHEHTPNTQVHKRECTQDADEVIKIIKQEVERRPYTDIAVINRIWALCAPIELAFLRHGIPYQLHHSQSVLDRSELRVFWWLFQLSAGPITHFSQQQRYEQWLHFLTTPYPKIKLEVLKQLASKMATFEQSYGVNLMHSLPDDLSQWQKQTLQTRAELLSDLEHLRIPAYQLVSNYVEQTELIKGIEEGSFSAQQADDQKQTVLAFIEFLRTAKITNEQALDYLLQLKQQRQQQQHQSGVQLISIHKSKGLEWPVVIIPGLNQGYYPYEPDGELSKPVNIESERRLLYVAVTRAQENLYLLVPPNRIKSKKSEQAKHSLFQFEMKIDNSLDVAQAIEQSRKVVELSGAVNIDLLNNYLQQTDTALAIKVKGQKKKTGK